MQPFYYLSKNTKMLSGALVVLALALIIPFSTYVTQQRVSTTPQAGNKAQVSESSIKLAHHQFDCKSGDVANGIAASIDCNDIKVGKTFSVDVLIRSDIDAANLINATLIYPNNVLSVEKMVTQGSGAQSKTNGKGPRIAADFFVSSWINKKFDNDKGRVQLIGAIPTPGFITTKDSKPALMARIYFKAKTAGQTNITIDKSSAIYRNADNVNILNNTQGLSFMVK